jgi:hypothetical protein
MPWLSAYMFSSQLCQLTDNIEPRTSLQQHLFLIAAPPTVALAVLRRTLALAVTARLARV